MPHCVVVAEAETSLLRAQNQAIAAFTSAIGHRLLKLQPFLAETVKHLMY